MDDLTPPPSAILVEKSVVSCCLQQDRLYRQAVGSGIDEACFHHKSTRTLFNLCATAQRGQDGEVDLVWLVSHLQAEGILDACGGAAEVSSVWGHALGTQGFTKWLSVLREMKARRMAMDASRRLAEAGDSDEAIQLVRDSLEALQVAVSTGERAKNSAVCIEEFVDRFKQDREGGDYPGRPTGLALLDAICGGMRDGQLWVIGGQTSRGKSVLMFQIAAACIQRGEKVLIFSLEMMADEIIGRLITVFSRIDHGVLNQPKHITKGDLLKMARGIEILRDGKYWIDDSAGQTMDTMMAEAQRIRDSHGDIALIVVDYVQLIDGHRGKSETREQEIARASKGLKQMAKAMRCPVITGSQLNEDGKTRESRAIMQDADCLLYIVDDGIKIGKLRNGRRDDVLPLFLNGAMQVFEEPRP